MAGLIHEVTSRWLRDAEQQQNSQSLNKGCNGRPPLARTRECCRTMNALKGSNPRPVGYSPRLIETTCDVSLPGGRGTTAAELAPKCYTATCRLERGNRMSPRSRRRENRRGGDTDSTETLADAGRATGATNDDGSEAALTEMTEDGENSVGETKSHNLCRQTKRSDAG